MNNITHIAKALFNSWKSIQGLDIAWKDLTPGQRDAFLQQAMAVVNALRPDVETVARALFASRSILDESAFNHPDWTHVRRECMADAETVIKKVFGG